MANYTGVSIMDYLKSIGQSSDFPSREILAKQKGITNYAGTEDQNAQLLNMLRTPAPVTPFPPSALQRQISALPKPVVGTTQPQQTTVKEMIQTGTMKPGVAPAVPKPVAPKPVVQEPDIVPTADEFISLTPPQQEKSKTDFLTQMGGMGLGPDSAMKFFDAVYGTKGKTEEELRTELYTKYGITDLENKFLTKPTQTFEDIYSKAFTDLGLSDLRTQIKDITDKVATAEKNRDEAIAKINENPWLPETSRLGRVRNVNDVANRELERLQNQLTLTNNLYERGRTEAEGVATRALTTFAQQREWTKEELDYYLRRAEADIEAKMEIEKAETEKEMWRYFPKYLKKYKKQGKEQELLTPSEAKTLGVPYGTTREEAAKMGITPKKEEKVTTEISGFFTKEEVSRLKMAGLDEDTYTNITKLLSGGIELDEIRDILRNAKLDPALLDKYDKAVGIEKVRGVPGAKKKSGPINPFE